MSRRGHSDGYRDSYNSFDKPDIMDKIGDSFSSAFLGRSRKKDKDDELLSEFSRKGSEDFFVDERAEQKRNRKQTKRQNKQAKMSAKKSKVRKPVSPLMRRVRNIITCCVIVAVVLIVCVILSLTVLFKTQNYEVSGNTMYSESEIISTCGIFKNENIFLANKKSAEKKLIKNYPYIEAADVSFSIPDTITIKITEAVPAYTVKVTESQYLIVSSKGRILETVESIEGYDIPLFLGPDASSLSVGEYIEFSGENTLKIINEVVSVFADNGYTGITEIDATDPANLSFTYDGRIKVKLGLPEDISYKVRTAMTIITEKLDLNGSKTTEGELDVSSCNTTKKSYFREQSLIDAQLEPTEPIDKDDAQNATDHIDEDGDGFDDITGEFIETEDTEDETEAPTISQDDWYL